ncbi:DUF4334 domain-containing protein [Mesorhizobium sp. M6A.T.Ce.TU.002.03.1.1]|nr:DUF4334 domain-containing protein [Mesorhizobium sp. M6A.T.Ce.TU.002.03.1.1]
MTRRIATPATLTANVGQWRSALFPIDLLIGAGSQLEGGSQSLRPKRQEASNNGSSRIQASLRMSSRRGKRAALMHDCQPVIDHLRTINDQHRLGLMDLRSMPQSFSSCSPAIWIMAGACTGHCRFTRRDLCLPALGRCVGAATLGVGAVALLLGPPTRTGRKARLSFRL